MVLARVFSAILIATSLCSAQLEPAPPKPVEAGVPQVTFRFVIDDDMPQVPELHMLVGAPSCTGAGTFYISTFDTPQVLEPGKKTTFSIQPDESGKMHYVIFGIDKKRGVHAFRPQTVDGLYDVDFGSRFFASDSEVYFLVTATKDPAQAEQQLNTPNGTIKRKRFTGEHAGYFEVFDHDGNFKRLVRIDRDIDVVAFGVFPSGKFLVTGFDHVTNRTELAMLDEGGTLRRIIEAPAGLSVRRALRQDGAILDGKPVQDDDASAGAFMIAAPAFFPSPRGLTVAPYKSNTVFDIDESGTARPVTIKVPKPLELGMFIPSNGRNWMVSFVDPKNNGRWERNMFHEVDPDTGQPLRQFTYGEAIPAVVGCFHDEEFLALTAGKNGELVGYRGSVQR